MLAGSDIFDKHDVSGAEPTPTITLTDLLSFCVCDFGRSGHDQTRSHLIANIDVLLEPR